MVSVGQKSNDLDIHLYHIFSHKSAIQVLYIDTLIDQGCGLIWRTDCGTVCFHY